MVIGIVLLAPLAISMLRVSTRLPVAIRIALRDLVRCRTRSGAALAAVTFGVFLAAGICVVASVQFEDVLNWTGPNLPGSQLIISTAGECPLPGRCGAAAGALLAQGLASTTLTWPGGRVTAGGSGSGMLITVMGMLQVSRRAQGRVPRGAGRPPRCA